MPAIEHSGLETLNHRSELKILWDTFRSQIAELWFHMIAGSQTIADDRRRSQTIAIAGSQAIAEVCFHMIAGDRRTFCDLRSAIRDRLRSYGNQPSGITHVNTLDERVNLVFIFLKMVHSLLFAPPFIKGLSFLQDLSQRYFKT